MTPQARDFEAEFRQQDENDRWDPPGERPSTTFLYVIGEVGSVRPVKIGYAIDVRARLTGLQIGNPRPLEIKAKWMFGSRAAARRAEELTHLQFSQACVVGEWFDVEAATAQKFIWESFMWRMHAPTPKAVGPNCRRTYDTTGGEAGA